MYQMHPLKNGGGQTIDSGYILSMVKPHNYKRVWSPFHAVGGDIYCGFDEVATSPLAICSYIFMHWPLTPKFVN